MNYQDTTSRALFLSVCEKSLVSDVTTEYALPDYEEEIRRLLRVNVTLVPPASYVGSGNACFSGTLRFDLLYLSPDGKLCMSKVSENFELSAPIDKDAEIDYSDEILAFCDILPESLVSRVLAPRKVSLKCRLRTKIRAYGKSLPSEKMTGDFSPEGIERLAGVAEAAVFTSAVSEDFDLSGETEVPRTGALSVLFGEGNVHIFEAQCSDGEVLCKGELAVRAVVTSGDSEPYAVTARLPFSERVEGDGFRSSMSCRAYGVMTELSLDEAEEKLGISARIRLAAEAQENVSVPYTRDLYSVAHKTEASYGRVVYPCAVACRNGNFTQSLYEPLKNFDIPKDAEILDFSATAYAENAICERGKWALVGESRMSLLILSGGEYRNVEIPIPFRYEFEGECGESESLFSELHMTGGRARIDGDRLALECEMGVSLRLCIARDAQMLREVSFGEKVLEGEEYIVCFPSKGDTLWENAKRYHVPLSRLRAKNKLDEKDTLGAFLIIKG